MYYEYWGLRKPPFDNVPDPSMYVDCHDSMDTAIAETLFGIEEGNECIAVIVGDVGLGKTLSIRMILDSLDQDKYKIALITNPGISFVQLLREIIGQLTGEQCAESKKLDLLEAFNALLFKTLEEGRQVLIFIDEANALTPANLENLRLLTNMQQDQTNLFTLILAGQLELAQRLEHPKRANLYQRIGTYSRIDKIRSEELLKAYVEMRIQRAGGSRRIFTDDAFEYLWEHSDHGVPRLINKIAKLSLKAGETNELEFLDGEVVNQIGGRFKKLARPAVQKRKPRKRGSELSDEMTVAPLPDAEDVSEISSSFVLTDTPDWRAAGMESVCTEENDVELHDEEEVISEMGPGESSQDTGTSAMTEEHGSLSMELEEGDGTVGEHDERTAGGEHHQRTSVMTAPQEINSSGGALIEEAAEDKPFRESEQGSEAPEEVEIGGYRLVVVVPSDLVNQARSYPPEKRMKLAGALAAQTLQSNQHVLASHVEDPVSIWGEIRNYVLAKFQSSESLRV